MSENLRNEIAKYIGSIDKKRYKQFPNSHAYYYFAGGFWQEFSFVGMNEICTLSIPQLMDLLIVYRTFLLSLPEKLDTELVVIKHIYKHKPLDKYNHGFNAYECQLSPVSANREQGFTRIALIDIIDSFIDRLKLDYDTNLDSMQKENTLLKKELARRIEMDNLKSYLNTLD